MGAQARSGIAEGAAVDRCQSRPAAKRARDRSGHRPGHRRAARAHRQPDRQYALRCVRPASGVGHLRRAKPISCDHGGGARVLAEPGHAEPDLCQHQRRCGRRHQIDQCARRNGGGNSAGAAATTAQIAGDTARNLANNALANTGRGATSTGAPVSTSHETMVPLSAVAHFGPGNTPLAVNHQNLFVASTISFNLAPGVSLSQATASIDDQTRQLGVPASIRGSFQGTARVFQQSLANEPLLIAAALLAVYIVLGVLYESYVHPITILSTLPSAGVVVLLAPIATETEFSIMALIGVILLIGIVKKNAIMMIDFALDAERKGGLSSR